MDRGPTGSSIWKLLNPIQIDLHSRSDGKEVSVEIRQQTLRLEPTANSLTLTKKRALASGDKSMVAMLRSVIYTLILVTTFQITATCGDNRQLPESPIDYARVMRPQLPPGWRCTYDDRTLVISHEDDVTFLNQLGLPDCERNEEFVNRYGVKSPYLIVMTFVSRLSETDQRALVDRRRKAVEQARKGREHEKYTGADVYSQHLVPEYFNRRFSIDLRTSDYWPLELVAPAEVVNQRDTILRLLKANVRKYPVQE